jgi:RNA-directed DNA polymerase
MATGQDGVVPTAMPLVLAPILEADGPACSYGYRPKRAAQQAARAMREDLDNRAWRGVEIDCQAYGTSIPPRQLLTLIARRLADGRLLPRIKQTLTVWASVQGPVVPTKVGGPHGTPIAPLDSHIYLTLLDHLGPRRDSPAKLGATLHRSADDALRVCRSSPQPVLAACEGIAKRMDVPLNRATTRVTRVTAGCDFLGFNFVKRTSPTSGQQASYLFPAQSAPQTMRQRLTYVTSRRAPISPKECVERVNPRMLGWVNSFRHTNASQAFRGVQRFVNIRLRRYLTQRSKGRGCGWKRFPNRQLDAMGLASMGSGLRASTAKPAHGVRGRRSDRRTRENGTYGGMGRGG